MAKTLQRLHWRHSLAKRTVERREKNLKERISRIKVQIEKIEQNKTQIRNAIRKAFHELETINPNQATVKQAATKVKIHISDLKQTLNQIGKAEGLVEKIGQASDRKLQYNTAQTKKQVERELEKYKRILERLSKEREWKP